MPTTLASPRYRGEPAHQIRSVDLTLDDIDDQVLLRVFDVWEKRAAGRPVLPAVELRPEELGPVLPSIALIDRIGGKPPKLRIRLTGEDIRNPTIGFLRDHLVDDIVPHWYADHLTIDYNRAIDAQRPYFQRIELLHGLDLYRYFRLCLPLSRASEKADALVVSTIRTEPVRRLMHTERLRY